MNERLEEDNMMGGLNEWLRKDARGTTTQRSNRSDGKKSCQHEQHEVGNREKRGRESKEENVRKLAI
jgi:hypothetical protein